MKLKFCRKEKGEGVNTEKPTSCIFSKRQKGRKRNGHREKAAEGNRGPMSNPSLGF